MTLPTLRTSRLVLREIERTDAAALFPMFSDPESLQYWSTAPFADVPALADWIAPTDDYAAWAVLLDRVVIGRVVLGERRRGVAEVGYLIARPLWGRGYAGEAVRAMVADGFARRGLRRIFADVDPDNHASIRLVERLGFKLEGRLRAEWETHIGIRDSLILGLLREEWDG